MKTSTMARVATGKSEKGGISLMVSVYCILTGESVRVRVFERLPSGYSIFDA